MVSLHPVHQNYVFDSLAQVRGVDHRLDLLVPQQLVVEQVLCMTHQQLAAIIYHADHLFVLVVQRGLSVQKHTRKIDDAVNGHYHVLADGRLVRLQQTCALAFNLQHLLRRDVFEADHVVIEIAASEVHFLTTDLVQYTFVLFAVLRLVVN